MLLLCLLAGCGRPAPNYGPVLSQLRNAANLVSAEYTVAKLVVARHKARPHHVAPVHRALLVARSQAILRTGVDFNRLQPGDISIQELASLCSMKILLQLLWFLLCVRPGEFVAGLILSR